MKNIYLLLVFLFSFSNIAFSQNATHYINAGNYYYSPSSLTINSGDTIVWLNDGGFHNVNFIASTTTGLSFGNPESFISSPTNDDTLYTHVFTLPGTYNYDCSVGSHASNGMTGSLIVNLLIYGCTDPLALNYDSLATIDDGSCVICYDLVVDTFSYSGGYQIFTVPSGVDTIGVFMSGAQGGYSGGLGGTIQANLVVTPGSTIYLFVGGQGGLYGAAGYNGGGTGSSNSSGGGGGSSDIRFGGTGLSYRVIIAGAGGGAGSSGTGGAGGQTYNNGSAGSGTGVAPGAGATYSAGGIGGTYWPWGSGTNGGLGYGGSWVTSSMGYGGGGGGSGWYGGGGAGAYSGGGGGNNWASSSLASNIIYNQGNNSGDGEIMIYYNQNFIGCTDSLAFNYDVSAICDDSSCVPIIYGCIDSLSLNFDSLANTDNGQCFSCLDTLLNNDTSIYIGDTINLDYINSFSTEVGVFDIDSNFYSTVVIRNQEWTIENLKTTKFSNGDVIPNITDNSIWQSLTTEGWCYWGNSSGNNSIYGKLYNWYTASDSRNLCPVNWRVPLKSDLDTLVSFSGDYSTAGGALKEAGYAHWPYPNVGATNSSGFTALPGGYRSGDGQFYNIGNGYFGSGNINVPNRQGAYWSSDSVTNGWTNDSIYGYSINMHNQLAGLPGTVTIKEGGISVRCMRSIPQFIWSTGDTTASISVIPTQTTTYWLIKTENGISCIDSITITIFIGGCTDSLSFNYNPNASFDDSSCISFIYGCTDSLAWNYNNLANTDNGNCLYSYMCPNPSPTGLFADEIVDIRATIHWDNMNTDSCRVWKNYIRYRKVGDISWTTKAAGVGSGLCNVGLTTERKILQNLSPNRTYEYKMKSFYCGGMESGYSSPSQFTTAADCPEMTNLTVQTFNGNHSKARFSWDTTGVYVFARVALRIDTAGASWQTAGGFGVYYPTFSVNKFGLQSGQSYRAQGRTFCDSNITIYRSWWTTPVFWTQPGSIRMSGGTTITNFDVYPNPSKDIFNISFVSENIQNLEVKVLNMIGAVVYTEGLESFVGEYTKQINLSSYTKGVYFLEITTNTGVVNKKIVLQ